MITVIISYKIIMSILKLYKMKRFFCLNIIFILSLFVISSCSNENDDLMKNGEHSELNEPFIATWINYNEIADLIQNADTQSEFEKIIAEKVEVLNEYKINNIFLQVRAFDDAFYSSSIVPKSKFCFNKDIDVLKAFVEVCHSNNIKIYAWINPYRIRNDDNINEIKNEFAVNLLENSEKMIVTDNSIYYNPAYSDIQKYILDCVKEIIYNYEIDGIHIDDYFYPTTDASIDKKIYNEFLNSGGKLSLNDYRRNCVNSLVSALYEISSQNNLFFSISPNANIDINYNELYADVGLWINEYAFADYIIPQIYFGFENENMPFKDVLNDWMKYNMPNKTIVGLAVYKYNKKDIYAGQGSGEWIKNDTIISAQIKYSIEQGVKGISFYSASYLYNNIIEENEKKRIISCVENWNYSAT